MARLVAIRRRVALALALRARRVAFVLRRVAVLVSARMIAERSFALLFRGFQLCFLVFALVFVPRIADFRTALDFVGKVDCVLCACIFERSCWW